MVYASEFVQMDSMEIQQNQAVKFVLKSVKLVKNKLLNAVLANKVIITWKKLFNAWKNVQLATQSIQNLQVHINI